VATQGQSIGSFSRAWCRCGAFKLVPLLQDSHSALTLRPCTSPTGEDGALDVGTVVAAWTAVVNQYRANPDWHEAALCLLLGNPLEAVERACADGALELRVTELLSDVHLPCTPTGPRTVVEVIKAMKQPTWRYHSEVRGLADAAVRRITRGEVASLNEVGCSDVLRLPVTNFKLRVTCWYSAGLQLDGSYHETYGSASIENISASEKAPRGHGCPPESPESPQADRADLGVALSL
jgi:hypothetical protein